MANVLYDGIRRFVPTDMYQAGAEIDASQVRVGMADVETQVLEVYSGFEDPGHPIPVEIALLAGIQDGDVTGQVRDDAPSKLRSPSPIWWWRALPFRSDEGADRGDFPVSAPAQRPVSAPLTTDGLPLCSGGNMAPISWTQDASRAFSHTVYDNGLRYYCLAQGFHPLQVANEFLRDYSFRDGDGGGEVAFSVIEKGSIFATEFQGKQNREARYIRVVRWSMDT